MAQNRGGAVLVPGGLGGLGIKDMVAKYTPESITPYAARVKAAREERAERLKGLVAAIENPQTLDDFTTFIRAKGEGALTPEQRRVYEDLRAAQSLEARLAAAERKSQVQAVGQTVGSEIIETKHTKKGHDLFVVQLAERVELSIYDRLNTEAKRLGGYYSAFRGNGAVPGFQFKTREAAEAFKALATEGDTTAATEAVQARRAEREEETSGNAVERLRAMADRLEEAGNESLGRDRLANTDRRARMANAAEAEARSQIQLAKTMRNLAGAIESGAAKFLTGLRTKQQVIMLTQAVRQAHFDKARTEEQRGGMTAEEKADSTPVTEADADFIKFPTYTLWESDITSLAGQMRDVPGMIQVAERMRRAADIDRLQAYQEAVRKDRVLRAKVMLQLRSGEPAVFKNKERALRSIARSGAKAVPVTEGPDHYVVLSPAEAIAKGLWQSPDVKVTLPNELGAAVAQKIEAYNARTASMRQIGAGWWPGDNATQGGGSRPGGSGDVQARGKGTTTNARGGAALPLKVAAVDVGSNAIRFLAARFEEPRRFEVLAADRFPVRLGHDVFLSGRLTREAMDGCVATLGAIAERLRELGVAHRRAVATSAIRESANGDKLLERVRRETGLELEVISGSEEARLVHIAVAQRMRLGQEPWILVDVGGGSVEVSLADENCVLWSESHTMGSVRLLEELSDTGEEPGRFGRLLEEYVATLGVPAAARQRRPAGLIATGGNVEGLARLAGSAPDDVGMAELSLVALRNLIETLAKLSFRQRVEQFDLREARADVILPAAMVYDEGLRHRRLPVFGVQFHPEACPGPTYTEFLFDLFLEAAG